MLFEKLIFEGVPAGGWYPQIMSKYIFICDISTDIKKNWHPIASAIKKIDFWGPILGGFLGE